MAWKQKKHDKFWKLAKEQGYRSRAAFKLIQLNKQYDFLGSSRVLLDLCAAPGGWLQVAAKHMPVQSIIIGVDLHPIKPVPGCKTFVDDITSAKCRATLKGLLQGQEVDTVIHDGAPNLGGKGAWHADAYGQVELVMHSLRLSTHFLKAGGTFVSKVFRSQDYHALLWVLDQFFDKTEATKPAASRATSAEIFVICRGYKAPKKIDPRLLDPSKVFKQVEEKKKHDVFTSKPAKRNRSGYDGTEWAVGTVSGFLSTKEPGVFLGAYASLAWDEASELYRSHEATTEEICELMKDLKLLGKGDFSSLVKWRRKMQKYRKELDAEEAAADREQDKDSKSDQPSQPRDEDKTEEELGKELEELGNKEKARQKLQRKKQNVQKSKLRKKMEQNKHIEGGGYTESDSLELFSASKIPNAQAVERLHETGVDGIDLADVEVSDEWSDGGKAADGEEQSEDEDLEKEAKRKQEELEANLDHLYQQFRKRRKMKDKQRSSDLDLEHDALPDDEREQGDDAEDEHEDGAQDTDQGILVSLKQLQAVREPSAADRVQRWFSRGALAGLEEDAEEAPRAGTQEQPEASNQQDETEIKASRKRKRSREQEVEDTKAGGEADEHEWDSAEELAEEKQKQQLHSIKLKVPGLPSTNNVFLGATAAEAAAPVDGPVPFHGLRKGQETDFRRYGFEEVPQDEDWSSDSEAQAEALAIGTAMIRAKNRRAIIDRAYNRYMTSDPDDLPRWFKDDEATHMTAPLPASRSEVDAFKEKLKAVNARPMKKIAEARARKKMKAVKRWEKVKAQAQVIANSEGGNEGDKLRQIEKLYRKKDKKKQKVEKTYVVSRKDGSVSQGKGSGKFVKRVDPRMKSDIRSQKRVDRLKKKGKSTKTQRTKSTKRFKRRRA
eukprot:g48895.t1